MPPNSAPLIPVLCSIRDADLRRAFEKWSGEWPTHVAAIPQVGDWVRNSAMLGLVVLEIIHVTGTKKDKPRVIVVLGEQPPCPHCGREYPKSLPGSRMNETKE